MKPLVSTLAAIVLAMGFTTPAEAMLRICNKTETAALVALGRFDGKDWLSEGWWRVPAKSCGDIVAGPLTARFYYLRAVQENVDGAWDSNRYFFCISKKNFTIKGRKQCHERGYSDAGFFEIDTGDLPNWTHNLSD